MGRFEGSIAPAPRWQSWVLLLAGGHNLLWGAWVIAFPRQWFQLTGMAVPEALSLWQGTGLLVAVMGIGFLLAARAPQRHWPVVLMGLMAKLAAPMGVLLALMRGEFTTLAAWIALPQDIIWWVPFFLILQQAAQNALQQGKPVRKFSLDEALDTYQLNDKEETLREASAENPLLLIFLRHFGCAFCRETLSDLRAARQSIEATGARMAVVHMVDTMTARLYLESVELNDLPAISDPTSALYEAFQLRKGNLGALFGPKVILRGLAVILRGHGVGSIAGDPTQMPGVFLLHQGRIVRAYRHQSVADRPHYPTLARPEPASHG